MARERFGFLDWFEGIVVSGVEGMTKPDEEIFALAIERFGLTPSTTVFIDDSSANVTTARRLGMRGVRFESAPQLRQALIEIGVLDQ